MESKGRTWVTVGVVATGLGFGWILFRGQSRPASPTGGQTPIPGPLGIPRSPAPTPAFGSSDSWSAERLVSALQSGDGRLVGDAIEAMKTRTEVTPRLADAFCDVLLSDGAPASLTVATVGSLVGIDPEEFRAALACALLRRSGDQIGSILNDPDWKFLVQRAQHTAGLDPAWMTSASPADAMRSAMTPECE